MEATKIYSILKPKNTLEEKIIRDQEFIDGVNWGKPRKGHPEGTVLAHIQEVLANVDKYGNGMTEDPLRIITLIHDTFKYKVDRSKHRTGDNHHAVIARKFAEKYLLDYGGFLGRRSGEDILDIIELHDEAYNCYLIYKKGEEWKAKDRLIKLVNRLGNNIPLYKVFYKCDNETGDKDRGSYEWFVNETKDAPLWHTTRKLDSFNEELEVIKKAGFNPIGVSQIMFEDTFIFETDEEAKRAYETVEKGKLGAMGWWYGREAFEAAKNDYSKKFLEEETNDNGYKTHVKVFWL